MKTYRTSVTIAESDVDRLLIASQSSVISDAVRSAIIYYLENHGMHADSKKIQKGGNRKPSKKDGLK